MLTILQSISLFFFYVIFSYMRDNISCNLSMLAAVFFVFFSIEFDWMHSFWLQKICEAVSLLFFFLAVHYMAICFFINLYLDLWAIFGSCPTSWLRTTEFLLQHLWGNIRSLLLYKFLQLIQLQHNIQNFM